MDIYDEEGDDLSEYDPSDLADYQGGFGEELDYDSVDLEENYLNCIQPTLLDTFQNFLYVILIVNIGLKVILIVNDALNSKFKNQIESLIILCGGLYLIYDFFRDAIYIGHLVVFSILIGGLLTYLSSRSQYSSLYVWIFSLTALFSNELLILNGDRRFRRLRAILMLLFMKFISLINHLEFLKSKDKKISFLDCLTYLVHPQSLPLGGWNSPALPTAEHLKQVNIIQNFLKYFQPFILSILFLLCSNCLISYLMSLIETSLLPLIYYNSPVTCYYIIKGLLNAYFVALQFRCSHYFISYTMQYIHYLWDHDVQITRPLSIEFPRSLVEVVIDWNRPMHEWLKNHLYSSLSNRFGDTSSRFLTFIVSSLMHGYDFRVWSVLITLAFLTWIEMKLRKKLSIRLNACIGAKNCVFESKKQSQSSWLADLSKSVLNKTHQSNFKCNRNHTRTPFNSITVNLINLAFSILCVIHLAFLGSAFDGNEDNGTISHVHEMWSFLHYYSIILFVPTFLVYKLI